MFLSHLWGQRSFWELQWSSLVEENGGKCPCMYMKQSAALHLEKVCGQADRVVSRRTSRESWTSPESSLHGADSSATIFRVQFGRFIKGFNNRSELGFADAPFKCVMSPGMHPALPAQGFSDAGIARGRTGSIVAQLIRKLPGTGNCQATRIYFRSPSTRRLFAGSQRFSVATGLLLDQYELGSLCTAQRSTPHV